MGSDFDDRSTSVINRRTHIENEEEMGTAGWDRNGLAKLVSVAWEKSSIWMFWQ